VAVALGFTSVLLSPFSLSMAKLYAAANWLVLKVLIHLVSLAAGLPLACLQVPRPSAGFMMLYYLFVILGSNLKRSRAAGRLFLLGALILLNCLIWHHALERDVLLSVLFFDVGQGDACLVRFPNGRTMLVDGGERRIGRDCGQDVLNPYFRRIGQDRLDLVVLTHADNDHVGGLPAVLEIFPVKLVLDSGARHHSATYLRFLALAGAPDVSYRVVVAGDELHIDPDVAVQVLHPAGEFVAADGHAAMGLNNASVVLRLQYGQVSFLLSGDIESEAEEFLVRHGRLKPAAVLKVPHHGSISSTTVTFLAAVKPRVAVISAGRENKFGHPHEEVLRRLRNRGTLIYRTDRHGAVMAETDGRTLRLETMLSPEVVDLSFVQKDLPGYEGVVEDTLRGIARRALFP
jgi:competence protein ComEC